MSKIEEIEYNTWNHLVSDYQKNYKPEGQWIFRGHESAEWKLKSTLERQLEKYGIPMSQASAYESQILREFTRKIRSYREDFIPNEALECISFIQHYGGPTRLVDWSYSFYVAAFFALAGAAPNSHATIWCFRSAVWDEHKTKSRFFGQKTIQAMEVDDPQFKIPSTHEMVFGIPQIVPRGIDLKEADSKPCVFMLNSRFINNRIVKQQGVFLVQTDLRKSYEENVENLLSDSHFKGSMRKLVIRCSPELIKNALIDLRRMTITYENLFDDINYFCKSLGLGIMNLYDLLTDSFARKLVQKKNI